MFTKDDRREFDNVKNIIIKGYAEDNAMLKAELGVNERYYREMERKNAELETKVELYEKFIAKMMEMDADKSNSVFMFNGELYRMANYTLKSNPGEQKRLTVEFDCTTPVTKNFREPIEIGFRDTKEA